MKKINIQIPELLELVKYNSIYYIAKEYGYSYATLYREVERLKGIEQRQREIQLAKQKTIAGFNNFIVYNADKSLNTFVMCDNKLNINEDIYFYFKEQDNLQILKAYKFEVVSTEAEKIFSIVIDNNSIFKSVINTDFDNIMLCNLIKRDVKDKIIIKHKNKCMFLNLDKSFNKEEKAYLVDTKNNKKGDISEIMFNAKIQLIKRVSNIEHYSLIAEVSDSLFENINKTFNYTTYEDSNHLIIKN